MAQSRLCSIDGKVIGDGHPVYLVAEAGATHTGLESAKKLVDIAVEAGFDAVKFQMVDADRLLSDKGQMFGDRKLYDILKQRELNDEEWQKLSRYCEEKDIPFIVTVTYKDHADKFPHLKISSGDIDYYDLIEYAATQADTLQIDTGNAELWEVEKAVQIVEKYGIPYILHHCPSGYPSTPEKENLRMIQTYKQVFGCPVGYSVHCGFQEPIIAAIAMGANLVEIPIKEYSTVSISPEARYAFLPDESKTLIFNLRNIEKSFGSPRRIMSEEERRNAMKNRRSERNGVWSRPREEVKQ